MKIQTSTSISPEVARKNEQRLRQAAEQTGHSKYFGAQEKLEIANDPSFPSVEELAKKARSAVPEGNPTLCWIAYQAALNLCGGDATCEAIAYAAYQACLKS